MPIDLVDLYDVLDASLHDGLEVHRTCCLSLCTTDFQSVVRVICFFVRRTSSPSKMLSISATDWKSVVHVSALGWRGRRGRWANAAELLAANKDEQDIRPATAIDHGLRQFVDQLPIGKLHSATQRIAGQFMSELP